MISKDQSIVTQVAAKIAAELTIKSNTDGGAGQNSLEATLTDWEMAFNFVSEALMKAHAVEVIKGVFPNATEVSNTRPTFTATTTTTTTSGGGVMVAGTQHGDLPSWLLSACAKAGVTKVWDNRDTAVGTKRPWFKSADGTMSEKGEPIAFWPPKGSA